jgi:hypothetical protein
MKKFLIGIAVLVSSYAHAEVYTYSGANFSVAFGAYTTAMSVTGSITTSSPIPPSSVDLDISGILTSWSFSDGLQTISNVNGTTSLNYPPLVSTDASGDITVTNIRVLATPLATSVGGTDDFIVIRFNNLVVRGAVCDVVNGGVCSDWSPETDVALNKVAGVWETVAAPIPTIPVPSMSEWALIVLSVLFCLITFTNRRHLF